MSAKVSVVPAAGNGADHLARVSAGDGKAHLKSRVGLDLDSQAKASALIRLYDSMADETAKLGLDDEGIVSMGSFYHNGGGDDDVVDDGGRKGREGRGQSERRRPTTAKWAARCREGAPRARKYSEFVPPLAPGAIRLLLFFLDDDDGSNDESDRGAGHLRAAADAAVAAALAELEKIDDEEGEKTERGKEAAGEEENARRQRRLSTSTSSPPSFASSLHVTPGRHMTVFQASHPASIVPDSTSESEDEEGQSREAENRNISGAPPPGALEREIAAARAAALAVGSPPRLVGYRVFLARSGALLLVLTEEEEESGGIENSTNTSAPTGGRVAALRREAAARMPRASKRQPAILHVTLGRLLSPLPSAEAARRVSVAAEEAARPFLAEAKEKKEPWIPRELAHVVEDTFASVDGDSVLLPFW